MTDEHYRRITANRNARVGMSDEDTPFGAEATIRNSSNASEHSAIHVLFVLYPERSRVKNLSPLRPLPGGMVGAKNLSPLRRSLN